MADTRRNLILGAALAVTLALVAWVERQEQQDDGLELARPERGIARPATPTAVPEKAVAPATLDWKLQAGREPVAGQDAVDLFKSHSWYVPPPPKPGAPPPPPPKPVAPPAPFTYMGKLEDAPQGTLVMLSAGNKLYTVAVGETMDKIWRLDGEDANSLRFTYLPLGLPQTLSKSAKPAAAKPAATPNTENQGTL